MTWEEHMERINKATEEMKQAGDAFLEAMYGEKSKEDVIPLDNGTRK